MRNQPKYNFFKNTKYALDGLCEVIKNENSFKIELVFVVILTPILSILTINLEYKIFMFFSLILVLICEAANSAIERVVDLVSPNYHKLAKNAKDIGSFVVFLSIFNACVIWFFGFYLILR